MDQEINLDKILDKKSQQVEEDEDRRIGDSTPREGASELEEEEGEEGQELSQKSSRSGESEVTNSSICEDDDSKFRDEILRMNRIGLDFIKQGDYPSSLRLLKAAERILVKRIRSEGNKPLVMKLLSITLNNMACYSKKQNRFQIAIRYLARVMQIEKYALQDQKALGLTYLNVAAILSHLKKHRESLKFAKKANKIFIEEKEKIMEQEMSSTAKSESKNEKELDNSMKEENLSEQEKSNSNSQSISRRGDQEQKEAAQQNFKDNFIISFFNLGAVYQALGKKQQALQAYMQGYHFSEIDLGADHFLTVSLKESYLEIKREINSRLKRQATKPGRNYRSRTDETSVGYTDHSLFQKASMAFGKDYNLSKVLITFWMIEDSILQSLID